MSCVLTTLPPIYFAYTTGVTLLKSYSFSAPCCQQEAKKCALLFEWTVHGLPGGVRLGRGAGWSMHLLSDTSSAKNLSLPSNIKVHPHWLYLHVLL